MDTTGVALAVGVAVLAAAILVWHLRQVRTRPATTHDRLMAAVWAAMIVLAAGRALWLVAGGANPSEPASPPPAPLGK